MNQSPGVGILFQVSIEMAETSFGLSSGLDWATVWPPLCPP